MIVAIPKDKDQLENEARSIAAIIAETQVDQRGDLLMRVAQHLKRHSQGFSAGLFGSIAIQSGL